MKAKYYVASGLDHYQPVFHYKHDNGIDTLEEAIEAANKMAAAFPQRKIFILKSVMTTVYGFTLEELD